MDGLNLPVPLFFASRRLTRQKMLARKGKSIGENARSVIESLIVEQHEVGAVFLNLPKKPEGIFVPGVGREIFRKFIEEYIVKGEVSDEDLEDVIDRLVDEHGMIVFLRDDEANAIRLVSSDPHPRIRKMQFDYIRRFFPLDSSTEVFYSPSLESEATKVDVHMAIGLPRDVGRRKKGRLYIAPGEQERMNRSARA